MVPVETIQDEETINLNTKYYLKGIQPAFKIKKAAFIHS